MAHLNQRWARDGVANEKAGDAALSPHDVRAVTGAATLRRARIRLLTLPRVAGLTSLQVTQERRGVRVSWPKFPEFQGMTSLTSAEDRAGRLTGSPLETGASDRPDFGPD